MPRHSSLRTHWLEQSVFIRHIFAFFSKATPLLKYKQTKHRFRPNLDRSWIEVEQFLGCNLDEARVNLHEQRRVNGTL